MNEEIIRQLATILNDNIGNRITTALGNGIITTLMNSPALQVSKTDTEEKKNDVASV